MPAYSLLSPYLALLAGAAASLVWKGGARLAGAISAWLAVALLVILLIAQGKVASSFPLLPAGGAFPLSLNFSAVSVDFSLALLFPAALLLTFQERTRLETSLGLVAGALALMAVSASGMFLTCLALGALATVLALGAAGGQPGFARSFAASQAMALGLLMLAVAVGRQQAGTDGWSAIPAETLAPGVFALIFASGLFTASAVPWAGFATRAWNSKVRSTGSLAVALTVPVGLNLVVQGYTAGAGRWPVGGLNLAVGAVGVAVAGAAAARALAAGDRRGCLKEMVVLQAGIAVASLALGTPLGVAAALSSVLATGALAAMLPLVPETGSAFAVLGFAAAGGVPPGLIFGARLLSLQAALGAGPAAMTLAFMAALSWVAALVALARGLTLGQPDPVKGSRLGLSLGMGLSLVAGAGIGGLVLDVIVPAAAELVKFPPGELAGGVASVSTASGTWPALALALPTLVLVAVALVLFGAPAIVPRPEPTEAGSFESTWRWPRFHAPSLGGVVSLRTLGAAAVGTPPWFWLLAIGVLAVVVTR